MAIIIPSKNIYGEIENEKVRNNLIRRIEINAVEPSPYNEYDTTVANVKVEETEIDSSKIFYNSVDKDLKSNTQRINQNSAGISASYVRFYNKYNYYFNIKIPIVSNNKYITKLMLGKDKENNPNIKYTLYGVKKQGIANSKFPLSSVSTGYTIGEGEINSQDPYYTSGIELLEFPKEISHTYDKTTGYNVTAKTTLTDTSTIANITQSTISSDGKYYEIKGQIMCQLISLYLEGWTSWSSYSGNPEPTELSMTGEYINYVPKNIEITIYGDTIGIDLKEKTLYIPNNDETSKAVFKVESNELMQTTNKDENSISALQKAYSTTCERYENGKETAKIRCSISDYYSIDEDLEISINKKQNILQNHNIQVFERLDGAFYYLYAWSQTVVEKDTYIDFSYKGNNIENKATLVIKKGTQVSSEIATGKISSYDIAIEKVYNNRNMVFEGGDQVIPMVFTGLGKLDRAMSYYSNGYAKVFEVVSAKYYYDGAVWQELDLLEYGYAQLEQSTLDSLANYMLKELDRKKLQSV